jgi:glycosyltransferase involved in cell wall biosynthesis
MKILFITDNFPPEVNAPASRTFENCMYWIKLGAEVEVVTSCPNFPQGKLYNGYHNKLIQKEIIEGISVTRLWTFIKPNKGFVVRILDFLSFSFMSFFYLLFKKKNFDIIIATSPQFFTGLTGMFISKIKNVPWIFEVRDLWPEGIILIKHKSIVYRMLEKLEKSYYDSATGIVTVTESFKENIQQRFGYPDSKIEVIYNGSNNNMFQPVPKNEALLKELNLESKFIVGYAGTLGLSHSLGFVLDCLPDLYEINKDIHFVFMGSGAYEEEMRQIIKDKNLLNATLLPSVLKNQVINYISIFDIGLVSLKQSPAFLKVIPSKIFDLSAMQIPILLGVDGEARRIIENYRSGVYYEPENVNDFVQRVLELYSNRKDATRFSDGLERLSLDFDRNVLAQKMFEFISKIVIQKEAIKGS